jgi:hypothetical protein
MQQWVAFRAIGEGRFLRNAGRVDDLLPEAEAAGCKCSVGWGKQPNVSYEAAEQLARYSLRVRSAAPVVNL